MDTSTKQCARCGEYKPLDAFGSKSTEGRYHARCKQCVNAIYHAQRSNGPMPPRAVVTERRCDQCGEIKPIAAFPGAPGGQHRITCSACAFPPESRTERRCARCGLVKPADAFQRKGKNSQTLRAWCRECERLYARTRYIPKPPKPPKPPAPPLTEKRCYDCGQVKLVDEFYRRLDGYCLYCKACVKIRQADYRNRTRAARNAYSRAYARRRPDIVRASKRKYNARWQPAHRDYLRNYTRERKRRLRTQYSEYEAARRARKIAASLYGPVDRAAIIARDASTCYLCGKMCIGDDLTLDHIIPLLHGGPHTPGNLRVACRSCNSAKQTKSLAEFLANRTTGKSDC